MKRTVYLSILSIFLFSFISCKKEVNNKWDDTLYSGLIRIACDANFKTLMDAEIRVFEAHNPKATIIPIYTSEIEAIRLLTEDSVRFALITRDLNLKEQSLLKKHSMKAKKYLIAFDGIALIINRANTDSVIGLQDLKKILTGEITEWSQLNPQSPLGTIRVIFDNKESGILRYSIDSITKGEALSSNLYALNNYLEVMERVAQLPNSIGLIGVNTINDKNQLIYQNRFRLLRISKEEHATVNNSYLPYAGDIAQENYPLWRPLYVILSDPKSGLSSGLSIFLANEIGQKIILKSGLLPVTDPQNIPVNIKDEYPINNIK
ncbi:MAG: substrate-binding domain-containing protein [Dysgonamonadaceae bacterium]|jgi:phosphate transport system substrate-binding protein|nr:substrate-binding domain-containing protein [Dysgonamonadaceae bacterium]